MDIISLRQSHRLNAKERAKKAVIKSIGKPPNRSDFDSSELSDYPTSLKRKLNAAMILALVAAGSISFFRLFNVGRNHFLLTIHERWQGNVVGFSASLLAEFIVIVSVVAMEVYEIKGWKKAFLYITAVCGMVMAFFGNFTIVQPDTAWGWIETIIPPLSVLSLSIVMEAQGMQAVKQRRAANKAYETRHEEYMQAINDPETHKDFMRFYATELKEEIIRVNGRSETRKQYLDDLSDYEWSGLVSEAMQADNWYLSAIHSANERTNEYRVQTKNNIHHSFTEQTNEHSIGSNGNSEHSIHSSINPYRKTMNAREYVREYFQKHPERLEVSLDTLQPEITAYAGVNVGRTTIHNVRKELERSV